MLVYIIDGFNLIHSVSILRSSNAPHYDLIHYIKKNKLTGSKNNKVIIVFDGKVNPDVAREMEFEIIFSRDRCADDVIIERVRRMKNKSEVVVVSDDREIRYAVKQERAKSYRIADFVKIKIKKQKNEKEISWELQKEITQEMSKIWLKDK